MFASKQLKYKAQQARQEQPETRARISSQAETVSELAYFRNSTSQSDNASLAAKSQQAAPKKTKKSHQRNMLDQLIFEEAGACALDFKKQIEREQKKLKKSMSRSKSKMSNSLLDSTKEWKSQRQIFAEQSSGSHSLMLNEQKVSLQSQDQGSTAVAQASRRRQLKQSTLIERTLMSGQHQHGSHMQLTSQQSLIRQSSNLSSQAFSLNRDLRQSAKLSPQVPNPLQRQSQTNALSSAFMERAYALAGKLRLLGVRPMGQLVASKDPVRSAVCTMDCLSDLVILCTRLQKTVKEMEQHKKSQAEAQVQQAVSKAQQIDESAAMRQQYSRLEAELDDFRVEIQQRESEAHKQVSLLKAQTAKIESRLVQSRHEIKKLQIENDKLRQTLKGKLNMKGSQLATAAPLVKAAGEDETLSEMVRDGFFEQMQSVNEETQRAQQFSFTLTKWIFDCFGLKLFKHMQIKDIDERLAQVSKRLKESETRLRATEVVQRNTHKPRSPYRNKHLYKVPTFGGKVDASAAQETETSQNESLFAHLDKREKGEDCEVSGSDNDEQSFSRQPKQSDLFQQGTAQHQCQPSFKTKRLEKKISPSIVQSESKSVRSIKQSNSPMQTPLSQSVSPFSHMQSEMAGLSNNLSNHGKGTTFIFDDY